ncbi:unnamed protein product [marine sediment metagenome]|uniref:Uncharacterized protein n=1 Tax=marine sediment metagenome TaxID=412755 RepID=X1NCT6_9ZZZZ
MPIIPHLVGTSEAKIASVSPLRTSFVVVCNHATARIYIRFTKGVAPSNGLPIYSLGSISMKIPEDDPTQEVWCISDTLATPVVTYEGYGK